VDRAATERRSAGSAMRPCLRMRDSSFEDEDLA
jgi:hypothetical protein